MKRNIYSVLIAAAACFILSTPLTAQAIDLGASAGVYIPGGDASKIYDAGFQLGIYGDSTLIPYLAKLRISGNYYNADGKKNDYTYHWRSFGVQGLAFIAPDTPILQPYIGAGYGFYFNTEEKSGHGDSRTKNSLGHGPVVQGGIGMNMLLVRLGIDAKYFMNLKSGDDYGGFNVGIGASMSF